MSVVLLWEPEGVVKIMSPPSNQITMPNGQVEITDHHWKWKHIKCHGSDTAFKFPCMFEPDQWMVSYCDGDGLLKENQKLTFRRPTDQAPIVGNVMWLAQSKDGEHDYSLTESQTAYLLGFIRNFAQVPELGFIDLRTDAPTVSHTVH